MKVAIHQPNYLPWLGYIHKIKCADVFVFLDDVQYSNQGGHNRNLIKTPSGKAYLTVPVEQHLGDKITQVRTKDELGWKEKHLHFIRLNYQTAQYFSTIYPIIEELLAPSYQNIAEMNIAMITKWSRMFGFQTEFIRSSEFNITSLREQKVLDICKLLGADCYISGNGARVYQDENHFKEHGIQLYYQEYKPVKYPQLWGDFIENMSALDYLMNCGFQRKYFDS